MVYCKRLGIRRFHSYIQYYRVLHTLILYYRIAVLTSVDESIFFSPIHNVDPKSFNNYNTGWVRRQHARKIFGVDGDRGSGDDDDDGGEAGAGRAAGNCSARLT